MRDFEDYKKWVMTRVNVEKALVKDRIVLGAMGLAGESGEVVDVLKKSIFHGRLYSDTQVSKLKEEMGDVLWYFALLCHEFNFTLDDLISGNVSKLENRYGKDGEKFHEARADAAS